MMVVQQAPTMLECLIREDIINACFNGIQLVMLAWLTGRAVNKDRRHNGEHSHRRVEDSRAGNRKDHESPP